MSREGKKVKGQLESKRWNESNPLRGGAHSDSSSMQRIPLSLKVLQAP
jgi:hypothetical protein